jgi:hypothetical protein
MIAPGAAVVERRDLRIGALLAEGGEGRVFELVDQPGVLLKAFRRPAALAPLVGLVDWPAVVEARSPELAGRVATAAAWPSAVVVDGSIVGAADATPDPALASGLLLPRAPRRFSLRHRGGDSHLATLSYLTAAPGQRAAAYGLSLPPPFAVDRIGIVYALARLLEALQAATPLIGHGDLSTKNVLWSLERGPEVFILDCDSAERYAADGSRLDAEHRRRAMTPNWDDPAVPPGSNPSPESDRYSLALIFLRVTAAAHFPIQGRQRRGEPLHIDFEVPPWAARARSLDPDAPVWDLCERSLGVARPEDRPPASSWAAALEEILDDLGAMRTVRAVWAAQGGGTPGPTPPRPRAPAERDPAVRVRPVVSEPRSRQWRRVAPIPASGATGVGGPGASRAAGFTPLRAAGVPAAAAAVAGAGPSVGAQFRVGLRRAVVAWLRVHRRMIRSLATRGSRGVGAARLAACAGLDLFLMLWALFILGAVAAACLKL